MIVKTEAVVLKTMRFRDTSTILTLYTQEFGKVTVIAKGARDFKSKFGSALQPMNHVLAVFYRKEHREMHLLSQCDVVKRRRRMTEEMERMAAGMTIIELVHGVTHAEEKNEKLFASVVGALEAIETVAKHPGNVVYAFEVRLSDILGFRANFLGCARCGVVMDERVVGTNGAELRLSQGGVVCSQCAAGGLGEGRVTRQALRVLQRLQEIPEFAASCTIALTPVIRDEVAGILRRYLQSHVDGLRYLKAESVLAAMM
ncbi:MAG: repair protein RecO [Bacteroidetes bacterium]|nr:repair protein RecO [Bacteroidota bacterium]